MLRPLYLHGRGYPLCRFLFFPTHVGGVRIRLGFNTRRCFLLVWTTVQCVPTLRCDRRSVTTLEALRLRYQSNRTSRLFLRTTHVGAMCSNERTNGRVRAHVSPNTFDSACENDLLFFSRNTACYSGEGDPETVPLFTPSRPRAVRFIFKSTFAVVFTYLPVCLLIDTANLGRTTTTSSSSRSRPHKDTTRHNRTERLSRRSHRQQFDPQLLRTR